MLDGKPVSGFQTKGMIPLLRHNKGWMEDKTKYRRIVHRTKLTSDEKHLQQDWGGISSWYSVAGRYDLILKIIIKGFITCKTNNEIDVKYNQY